MASRTVCSSGVGGGDESGPPASRGSSSAGGSTARGQGRPGAEAECVRPAPASRAEPPGSFSEQAWVFSDLKTNKLN